MAWITPDTLNSRIANASKVWQAACDGDVINWNKANEFIYAKIAKCNTHGGCSSYLGAQWRNVTDAGPWTDLASGSGEMRRGSGTVLVSCTSPTLTPSGCQTLEDSHEVEDPDWGAILTTTGKTFVEMQFAVDPSGGDPGDEYSFRLYDSGGGVGLPEGTAFATITLASAAATQTLSGAQAWNAADDTQKAACDTNIANHPKAEDIWGHVTVSLTGGGSATVQNKIQWRNKTDNPGGAWNDLGVNGPQGDTITNPDIAGIADDAAHANQHTCSPVGTFDAGGSVYDDNGSNTAPNSSVSVDSGEFYVQAFALGFGSALNSKEYEFRLYDIPGAAAIGTLGFTVTIEAAGPTVSLSGSQIWDEPDTASQAACDGNLASHTRTTPLIMHVTVSLTGSGSKNTQNKLQWRNKTKQPSGSFQDLGTAGPDGDTIYSHSNPNFTDDQAHPNSHTCSPVGSFKAGASVYDDAGSNQAPNVAVSVAAGEFYIQAFCVLLSDTILGDEYEFRLWDLDGSVEIGILVATVTIESPGTETLAGAQFYNEADDTAEAACDGSLTDWVKSTALLLHVTVNVTVASVDVQNKIQWRNKTKQPAGSWNDLDSAGADGDTISNPDNPNFADDAAHPNSHTCSPAGSIDIGASVYDDAGSNTAPNTKNGVLAGFFYVQAFAVGFSAGISGDEYEFRLYSIEKAAAIGTVAATVTLELVPIWGDYGAPILWEPNDYDPAPTPYFEAVLYAPNPGETAFARLYDKTADAPISGSELQSTSQTPERTRSGALTFPSVDSELQGQVGAATGQTAKIKMARIIPKQVAA